jgi:succinate dehydrogenase / fumarate reductase membrane anchor subunit|tara:strand:- start:122 stop:451 length:330 start_codon:yes stop_codon:yes gene_type:complete
MNLATKKWIFLKISSIIIIPLMFWFIFNFVSIYDQSYFKVLKFFTNSTNKFLFSLFIIFTYFFSALSISEVFEDYITHDKIKNVANKLLFIFAIVIPLLTIIFLFNLNL